MTDLSKLNQAVQSGQAQVEGGEAVGPDGQQPLTPQEARQALQDAADQQAQQAAFMLTLMKRLQDKCDEVVRAKRPIEQRMIDDIRQYDGIARIRTSKQDVTSVSRSNLDPPRIHATRSRCDALESRLCDMLFPTNDHPWDITPTPDDEWEPDDITGHSSAPPPPTPMQPVQSPPQQMQQPGMSPQQGAPQDPQGQPQQAPQPGQPQGAPQGAGQDDGRQDAIEQACLRMKKVIQDQLSECKFTTNGRRMVRDACRYGFGILEGPFVTTKVQRRFNGPQMSMNTKEVPIPSIKYCDPWCFFPDMTPTLDKAEFVFKLNLMSGREVQELADLPGFDKDELKKLLREDPDLGELKINLTYRNSNLDRVEPIGGRYAVWRYTGTLDKKDLDALSQKFPLLKDDLAGCGCEDGQENDLQQIPMVDMWYAQGHPLKVRIRPIERDFRVPYYVFSPFPADDTIFGYGIPYLTRDSQRVVDAAWQITLHNASVGAGPQIITRAGKIEPRDRSYEVKGPKIWEVTDPDMPLENCMRVENINSNLEADMAVLDRALQILDDEAMTPQVLQGDATQSVPTSSGLAMLFNAASIVMRRSASCFDDDVALPIMQRMYWWNMLYNNRQDIKGDYDIVPLGQSKMLVRDVQIQHMQSFLSMTTANPTFAPFVNAPECLKLLTNMLELPTDKVLNDINSVKQQMSQQPDPQALLAQANVQKTQAQAKELESRANMNVAKAQAHAMGDQGPSDAEVQLQQQDVQVRREEAQASVESASLKLQADMQKIHSQERQNVNDNASNIHVAHVKAATDIHKENLKAMKPQGPQNAG